MEGSRGDYIKLLSDAMSSAANGIQSGARIVGREFTNNVAKPTFQFMQDQTARSRATTTPPRPGYEVPANPLENMQDSSDAIFAYLMGPAIREDVRAQAARKAMREFVSTVRGAVSPYPDSQILEHMRVAGDMAVENYDRRMGELKINPRTGRPGQLPTSPYLANADSLPPQEPPAPVIAEQAGLTYEPAIQVPKVTRRAVTNYPGNTQEGGRTVLVELAGQEVESPEQAKERLRKEFLDVLALSPLEDKGSTIKYTEPRPLTSKPPEMSEADWIAYQKGLQY